MKGCEINDKFDKGYFIEEKSIEILCRYICGNLVILDIATNNIGI